VPNKLGEQFRECLQHAESCALKAKTASSAELRDDYLTLEKRWLSLAQSHGRTLEAAMPTISRDQDSTHLAQPNKPLAIWYLVHRPLIKPKTVNSAWARHSAGHTFHCRGNDRMRLRSTDVYFWHKADMPVALTNVRFQG
jgi:hypothetical protein